MQHPASAPEDHRGGAVAGRRSGAAGPAVGRRRGRRPGRRLRQRRHRRVRPRHRGRRGDRRRRALLPRDEHPAAGGAPGDRGGDRPRPGPAAAAGGRRRARCPTRSTRPSPAGPVGHAVEARLYAEDPAAGWLPSTGDLHEFAVPEDRPGVRVDAGVESGGVVSPHYDPMLAKVIVHAPTRDEAVAALAATLADARIHGVTTNRDLLVRTLRHDGVRPRRHRHRVPRPPRARRAGRTAGRRRRGRPPRRGRRALRPGRPPVGCPGAGAAAVGVAQQHRGPPDHDVRRRTTGR